jgi:hypothetical protein
MNIAVKLFVNNGEVRRFNSSTSSFEELKMQCLQVAQIPLSDLGKIILKYQDNEGDDITFSSDPELSYAITMSKDLLKIKLELPQNQTQPEKPAEEIKGMIFKEKEQINQARKQLHQSKQRIRQMRHQMHDSDDGFKGKGHRGQWRAEHGYSPRLKEFNARFVSHVSIQDNEELRAGSTFTKTWKLRNSGLLKWPDGCKLVRLDRANDLNAPEATSVTAIEPEQDVEVSVSLTCPSMPGSYATYFKMCTPEGKKFGQRIRCQILAITDSGIVPERITKVWEQLESMGFVAKGQRPAEISVIIVESKADINTVVKTIVDRRNNKAPY